MVLAGQDAGGAQPSLAQALNAALRFKAGTAPDALETYIAACRTPASFAEFVGALLQTDYWAGRALPDTAAALKTACLGLAAAIDVAAHGVDEPAYHCRRHFKEVCLGLSLLLAGAGWPISDEDAWILLLAAIGHDYGHEGRPNHRFGELEEKSCGLVADYLQRHPGVDAAAQERVAALIRATEPSLYSAVTGPYAAGADLSTLETMKILLVEADLFASMLPEYGILLGNWLSEEFRAEAPQVAQVIASPAGRLGFLKAHPYVSPNSKALNFGSVIESAVAKSG